MYILFELSAALARVFSAAFWNSFRLHYLCIILRYPTGVGTSRSTLNTRTLPYCTLNNSYPNFTPAAASAKTEDV